MKLAALALALAGMVLTIAPALGDDRSADAAPASLAGIGIRASRRRCSTRSTSSRARGSGGASRALPMSTVVIASAAAVFVVAALVRGPQWPQTAAGWLAVLAIALLSTVAAITLYFAGLERDRPDARFDAVDARAARHRAARRASCSDERIAPVQIAGGALILAAVVLLARARTA